jgi:signal transduction histidine kinase
MRVKEGIPAPPLAAVFPGESEMARRMRALDWSRTSAGPVATWPESLKTSIRIVLHSRHPMFIWWRRDELIYFYNDAYIPILGKKHPDALGWSGAAVWPEIWETIGPLASSVFREGRATWFEELPLVMERRGYREETFFTFSYSPILEVDGDVGGLFCACIEETSRVIARRRLRTQRELATEVATAQTIAGACAESALHLSRNPHDVPFALIYLLSDDGRSFRLGAATADSASRVIATEGDVGGDGDVWSLAEVAARRVSRVATDIGGAFRGAVPAGSWDEPPRDALVVPLGRPGHETLAGIAVFGISPRRAFDDDYRGFFELVAGHVAAGIVNARAHAEERRRAEALAEIDRAKTAFFSNVSHEFRTPLTLMLGPLEDALASPALPQSLRDGLGVAHRNSLRLLKLVNTLLDFSRIEAGRAEAFYEESDVGAFTSELASVFRAAAERAGLSLEVSCEPVERPVYLDRGMWEKVVLNLLSNAFKFTLEGGIAVTVREVGEQVIVSVRDTGCGIPAADLPHVFERFHRVRGARGRTHEGTGIGLALVQELVQLHGGTVTAESELGRGTTFRIALPTGSAHLPKDRLRPTRPLGATPAAAAPYVEEALGALSDGAARASEGDPAGAPRAPGAPAGGARVLLADDNPDMRDYLRRLLAAHWEVECVMDGDAALAAVRARPPDLVVSDIMMPKRDGFEVLKAIREDPATRTLPVILLSARAGEEARVEGIEAGADDYLTKPFSARELLARVHTHLELARVRRQLLAATERARGEAEAANQAKDAFLAVLSHELRSPMNAMLGWLRILKTAGTRDTELVGRAVDTIERNIWVQAQVINDLLDVSRIISGKLQLEEERVDVASVVTKCVDSMRPSAEAKQIELRMSLGREDVDVIGDDARLQQVFGNLLGNAIKFTPAGGVVSVAIDADDREVRIAVEDSGQGIAPEFLPHIFERFRQADDTTARKHGGLGLGLAIVKNVVELHGGHVRAESAGLDRGARFVVLLPRAERRPRSAYDARLATAPAAAEIGPVDVLVVEDEGDSRGALALALEESGARVRCVASVRLALEAYDARPPDVLISDIGMPGEDGYVLIRAVRGREDGRGHRTIAIAITGFASRQDREMALRAGFDDHVAKPIEPDIVLERMRALAASRGG